MAGEPGTGASGGEVRGLDLRVLGPVELRCGGRPVPLGGPRQRAILTYLALQRGTVAPTARIIDAVWGDQAPASVGKSLTTQLARIRRALAPAGATVEHVGHGYRLVVPDGCLDLVRAEALVARGREEADADPERAVAALREALDLWRGEPLVGLGSAPFAAPTSTGLVEMRRSVEDRLVGLLMDLGELDEASERLHAQVEDTPYAEHRWARLVDVLSASGRRRDALQVYHRARARLREDLGLDPGAALQEAERRALGGGSSRTPRAADARMASGFIGRLRELRELEAHLDAAADGLQVVTVTGEAGIGKTRLVDELAARARGRGLTVLHGACAPDVATPLGPWREALGRRASTIGEPEEPDHWSAGDMERARARLTESAGAALEARAGDQEQVLLVVLEDLHWADPLTVEALTALLERRPHVRAAVVVTGRPGSSWDALRSRLDGAGDRRVRHLPLRPLSGPELHGLVRHLTVVDAQEERRLLDTEYGHRNALFVTQYALARENGEALPEGVDLDTLLRARLAALPDEVSDVVAVAAVLGELDVGYAAGILDESRSQVDARARRAERAGLLRQVAPGRYAFAHHTIREAAGAVLPGALSRRLHRQAVDVLERAGAPAARLAWHARDAGAHLPAARRHQIARRAGEAAAREGALEAAAEHLRLAESLAPDPLAALEVRIRLGTVLLAAGDGTTASALLAAAVDTAVERGAWHLAADAVLARASVTMTASTPDALQLLARVDHILGSLGPEHPDRRIRLLCWAAELSVNIDAERCEGYVVAADAEVAEAPLAGDRRIQLDLAVRHVRVRQASAACAPPAELESAALALLQDALACPPGVADAVAASTASYAQEGRLRAGHFELVRRDARRLRRIAEERHVPWAGLLIDGQLAGLELATGTIDSFQAASEAATTAGYRLELEATVVLQALYTTIALRERGELSSIAPMLAGFPATRRRRITQVLLAAAQLEKAPDQARRTLAEVLPTLVDDLGPDWTRTATLALAIDIAYDLGTGEGIELGDVEAAARGLEPLAGEVVVLLTGAVVLGSAARFLGRAAHLAGRHGDAVDLCRMARLGGERSGGRLWVGWAAHDEAAARLARGMPGDGAKAAALLDQAAALATATGSARLHRAIERARRGGAPG